MALIKCPECGKDISDKAVACMQCGFPVQQTQMKKVKNEKVGNTRKISPKVLKVFLITSITLFVVFFILFISSVWYLTITQFFGSDGLGIGIIVEPIVMYCGIMPVRILAVVSAIVVLISTVSTIVFGVLVSKQRKQ